ncbi:MAG: response regulator [Patescibacteria group bacterium]|nr:response regulator [Patescibacteria group bacterium]
MTPSSSAPLEAIPRQEKVLLIVGDGAMGEQLADALRADGYPVALVKEGTQALQSIYDQKPQLVILDVTLTGADSYDVLAKKQADPAIARVPLYLMSVQGVPINMHKVPEGSVEEFLMALHLDPADVVQKVDRRFGHSPLAERSAAGPAADKLKVLWVEDDKLISTMLSKKLISSGFDLFHASNGTEALSALKQTVPDIIVLDVVLPGMSGFDILQEIKKDAQLSKVPVMILSNLSKQSDIEKAQILGAQKFLVKAAASLDEIVSEIRSLHQAK